MTKRYSVEVDCANCAAKMEAAIGKIPGVCAVSIHYLAQKMTLTFADGADEGAILQTIVKTCKKIDSDFSLEV